ncbi:MAG TPA: phosphoenolpyruvate carboxykinase domain-containing protein, partial [Rhodanobacteraceae bacterium]|nr:phosphoenolpyruvate carboxykinase domain-containing protein [Rhodanobacteraceae bacterium]
PSWSPEAESDAGVPIDAIVFGGRRGSVVPLVFEARDWTHGVLVGASMASETTAAATDVGVAIRRDPMAMKPFCGYNYGDYFAHWLSFDQPGAKLPKVFHVNWFRKGKDGRFLWPGFGDNMRVLEWMLKRVTGEAGTVDTPIGNLPRIDDLNLDGLNLAEGALDELFRVDNAEWRGEEAAVGEYLAGYGTHLPDALKAEHQRIIDSLDAEASGPTVSKRAAAAS